MTKAIARHRIGEVKVIPIILREYDWHSGPLGGLQALPKDGKAVVSWPSKDKAFADVANGVRLALKDLSSSSAPRS